MVILTNMTKQIQNKYCCNSSDNGSTTVTSKKVCPNDRDNDRQPEIAIWPPKQEGVIFPELYDR